MKEATVLASVARSSLYERSLTSLPALYDPKESCLCDASQHLNYSRAYEGRDCLGVKDSVYHSAVG